MPELDCGKCSPGQKIARGCTTPATRSVIMDGEELKRCPRRPLLDEPEGYGQLFWLYGQALDGKLPEPGGIYDQSARTMECFRVIAMAISLCDEEKARRSKKKNKDVGEDF